LLELRQAGACRAIEANVLVIADGLNGGLLRRLAPLRTVVRNGSALGAGAVADEAPAFFRPHVIFMACGSGGYVGLVRLEDGRLNLAMAMQPALLRCFESPGAVAAALIREAGWPDQ